MSELLTERGYEEPCVRQISLFLQNRVGELGSVLRHLDKNGISLHAISVDDSVDHAVMRIVVDDFENARQMLRDINVPSSVSEVLAVELGEEDHVLLDLCRTLIRAEINIHYAYSMLTRPRDRAVALIHVDDNGTAVELLRQAGFHLFYDRDLAGPSLSP